jgi:AbrB family looped-hinge helix DNA binding protein
VEHNVTYQAKIISGGKVVIPAEFRRKFGLQDGDTVLIDSTEGGIIISTYEQRLRSVQQGMRENVRAPFTVDDFIAERRAEAERE